MSDAARKAEDFNPYAAPITDLSDTSPRRNRWRLIPATFFSLLGLVSFMLGLYAVGMLAHASIKRSGTLSSVEMIAGCSLYLGVGLAWMMAGWSFWRQRHRRGLIAALMGILIPVVLFSILGF